MDPVKHSKASSLRRFISLFRPFMGSVAYLFKSNVDGLRTIWQHWVKTPISDIGVVFSTFVVFLSGLILYKAKNRNFGKTFDFLYSALQATFALLTLAAFATGTILAIAITAMALNLTYLLGSLAFSFYKYKSYSKNSLEHAKIRQAYKNEMVQSAKGLIIGAVVLTSFLVVSVFFPYIAAVVSMSIGLATSSMLLCLGFYTAYKFFYPSKPQNKKKEIVNKVSVITSNPQETVSSTILDSSKSAINLQVKKTEVAEITSNNQKNVSSVVLENNKSTIFNNLHKRTFEYYHIDEQLAQLTDDLDKNRKTLIIEAYKSILQLKQEIFKSRGGGSGFWNQEPKRLAKLDFYKKGLVFLLPSLPSEVSIYLRSIDGLIEPDVISLELLYKSGRHALIRENLIEAEGKPGEYYSEKRFEVYLNRLKQNTFQSFWRDKGKVEVFIQAIKSLFETIRNQEKIEKSTFIIGPVWSSISQ
ncbi:MAG: hypothetical protein REH83_01510 [Rickettsiella sp.]|nr:hypothetical protein [Rickettsiella sp.]